MNRLDKYLREDLKTYTTSNSFINEIYKFSQYKIRLMLSAYIYVSLHEMTCIRGYNESVYVMCTERYTSVY